MGNAGIGGLSLNELTPVQFPNAKRVSGRRFKLFCPPLTLTEINICTRSMYIDWSLEKTQCHIMGFERMGWPGWHIHLGCFFNTVLSKGGGGLFYLKLRHIYTVCSVFLEQTRFYKRLLLWPQGATLSNKRCQELFANLLSLLKNKDAGDLAFSSVLLLPVAYREREGFWSGNSGCFLLFQVVEFCNASTHNHEAPNPQNQKCSLRSTWDVITESSDFHHSLPMRGVELPPPPTFSLMQAGDKVICLVMDVSKKMSEVTHEFQRTKAHSFHHPPSGFSSIFFRVWWEKTLQVFKESKISYFLGKWVGHTQKEARSLRWWDKWNSHRISKPISNAVLLLIVAFLPQDRFLKLKCNIKRLPGHTPVTLRGCDWEWWHSHRDEDKGWCVPPQSLCSVTERIKATK